MSNKSGQISPQVHAAVARLSRVQAAVVGVVIIGEAAWALWAGYGFLTWGIAALASVAMVVTHVLLLRAAVRNPQAIVGAVGGGYILKVICVFVAILTARFFGADRFFVGICLISVVLAMVFSETVVLMRARIPHVDPRSE